MHWSLRSDVQVCNNRDMTQSIEIDMIPEFDTADRMRKSLRASNVGVQEMAEYLGVARNTVGNWINGRIEPSTQTLRLWALRTGVPFKWLQTGETPTGNAPDGGSECPQSGSNRRPADYKSVVLAFPAPANRPERIAA